MRLSPAHRFAPRREKPVAALAQLVEHIIRNDGVACSSHASGTTIFQEHGRINTLWLVIPRLAQLQPGSERDGTALSAAARCLLPGSTIRIVPSHQGPYTGCAGARFRPFQALARGARRTRRQPAAASYARDDGMLDLNPDAATMFGGGVLSMPCIHPGIAQTGLRPYDSR